MFPSVYREFILPFLDLVYPPVCFTCNSLRFDRTSKLCAQCWNTLTRVDPDHPTWREIRTRMESEGLVSDILSCFLFEKEGKLQEIVHLLKYRGITSIGVELGRRVGEKMLDSGKYDASCVLVPAPLHRLRMRERGYNQSEFICRGISEVTGMVILRDLLVRRRNTLSQTKLTLDERKANVREAFQVKTSRLRGVEGTTFVLVDDVITTGSTIEACARELRAQGVGTVLAASVALAEQKHAAPSPPAPHPLIP